MLFVSNSDKKRNSISPCELLSTNVRMLSDGPFVIPRTETYDYILSNEETKDFAQKKGSCDAFFKFQNVQTHVWNIWYRY